MSIDKYKPNLAYIPTNVPYQWDPRSPKQATPTDTQKAKRAEKKAKLEKLKQKLQKMPKLERERREKEGQARRKKKGHGGEIIRTTLIHPRTGPITLQRRGPITRPGRRAQALRRRKQNTRQARLMSTVPRQRMWKNLRRQTTTKARMTLTRHSKTKVKQSLTQPMIFCRLGNYKRFGKCKGNKDCCRCSQ